MHNRLADASDLQRCTHLSPALASADGRAHRLLAVWLRDGRAHGATYEGNGESRPFGAGFGGFVRGHVVEAWNGQASRPMLDFLCELSDQTQSPLLDAPGIAAARRDEDLHAMVFVHALRTVDPLDPRSQLAFRVGAQAYWRLFAGYGLQGIWHEMPVDEAGAAAAIGLRVVARHDRWIRAGFTRADRTGPFPANVLESLFIELPRRLELTPAQQQVAYMALWNLEDDAVAARLGIAPETVRRHWRNIYERMDRHLKGSDWPPPAAAEGQRGPDRRRRALDYLQQHIHEVRPA